eukprot:6202153-Pleurochrysis_carterae.AAC.4
MNARGRDDLATSNAAVRARSAAPRRTAPTCPRESRRSAASARPSGSQSLLAVADEGSRGTRAALSAALKRAEQTHSLNLAESDCLDEAAKLGVHRRRGHTTCERQASGGGWSEAQKERPQWRQWCRRRPKPNFADGAPILRQAWHEWALAGGGGGGNGGAPRCSSSRSTSRRPPSSTACLQCDRHAARGGASRAAELACTWRDQDQRRETQARAAASSAGGERASSVLRAYSCSWSNAVYGRLVRVHVQTRARNHEVPRMHEAVWLCVLLCVCVRVVGPTHEMARVVSMVQPAAVVARSPTPLPTPARPLATPRLRGIHRQAGLSHRVADGTCRLHSARRADCRNCSVCQ